MLNEPLPAAGVLSATLLNEATAGLVMSLLGVDTFGAPSPRGVDALVVEEATTASLGEVTGISFATCTETGHFFRHVISH